jgi:hypothetical protein
MGPNCMMVLCSAMTFILFLLQLTYLHNITDLININTVFFCAQGGSLDWGWVGLNCGLPDFEVMLMPCRSVLPPMDPLT